MRIIAVMALYMACVMFALRSPSMYLRTLSGAFLIFTASYFVIRRMAEWGRQAWLRGEANGRQAPEQLAESERGGRESVG
jgi:hypothetical protein